MTDDRVELADGTVIGPEELAFHFSRSGGPGGQNVNKVATKAELRFHPAASACLSPSQKNRIYEHLGHRIRGSGQIVVTCQRHRRQLENRRACLEKLAALLDEALAPRKVRIPTRPSRASKKRRLSDKRAQGQKKDLRRPPRDVE